MRFKQAAASVIFLFILSSFPAYGQVVATWTDSSGNWSSAGSWSTTPVVPNNSGGITYDVVINGTGTNVVTFDVTGTVINSLNVGSGITFQDNGNAPTLRIVAPSTSGIGTAFVNEGTLNWGNGANLSVDISSGDQFFSTNVANFTNSTLAVEDSTGTHTLFMSGYETNLNHAVVTAPGNMQWDFGRVSLMDGSVGNVTGQLSAFGGFWINVDHSNLSAGSMYFGNGVMMVNSGIVAVQGDFHDGDSEVRFLNGSAINVGGNFNYSLGGVGIDRSSMVVGGNYTGSTTAVTGIYNGGSLVVGGNYTTDALYGQKLIVDNGSLVAINGYFNNLDGSASITASQLSVHGDFINTNASVVVQGGGLVNIGGTFLNSGQYGPVSPAGLELLGAGNLLNVGGVQNGGLIQVDSGSVMTVNGGGFANDLGANLTSSGSMEVTGGFVNSGGSVILNPTATLVVDRYSQNSGLTNVSGALLAGSYNQTGGITTIENGGLVKATTFTATGGTVTVNGVLDPAAVEFGSGSTLQGSGTIIGNVAMGGTLLASPENSLTIFGNYEQIGNGTLEALISPTSRALLDIHGDVALGGGSFLDLILADGYDPLGQTFAIMQYASLVGQFSNGSSFCEDGYLWNVTYGSNQIDVTAVATPEPGSLGLLVVGLIGLILLSCRRWGGVVRSLGAAQ